MIFDKKKAASVILSRMGSDGRGTETPVKPETGEHDEYTELAESLLSSVKEGSVQGVASVLRSVCEMGEDEEV